MTTKRIPIILFKESAIASKQFQKYLYRYSKRYPFPTDNISNYSEKEQSTIYFMQAALSFLSQTLPIGQIFIVQFPDGHRHTCKRISKYKISLLDENTNNYFLSVVDAKLTKLNV